MFGRRKRQAAQGGYRPGYEEPAYEDAGFDVDRGAGEAGGGPWDSADPYPELARVDLGSLLVPVGPDYELQLVLAEQQGAWVTVHHGASDLQLQAFAAPRNTSLWDEVRGDIASELGGAGGSSREQEGPFGPELLAQVPSEPSSTELVPVRFVGVDGPRWFLRGMFSGAAAISPDAATPLENLFREVVVVRGDHPIPPRDLLELRLPAEAQQQLAEQQEQAQAESQPPWHQNNPPSPFDRGPEFTETR